MTDAKRLSGRDAAEIARRRGLTAQDAAALLMLADNVTEAKEIADVFAADRDTPDTPTEAQQIVDSIPRY